jgi:hypothetical protein
MINLSYAQSQVPWRCQRPWRGVGRGGVSLNKNIEKMNNDRNGWQGAFTIPGVSAAGAASNVFWIQDFLWECLVRNPPDTQPAWCTIHLMYSITNVVQHSSNAQLYALSTWCTADLMHNPRSTQPTVPFYTLGECFCTIHVMYCMVPYWTCCVRYYNTVCISLFFVLFR